jgi:hypothetical protein
LIKKTLIAFLTLVLLAGSPAFAGLALDQVLNYMFLDQTTSAHNKWEQFDAQRAVQLTKDAPVGQTFITGPETETIVRIRCKMGPDKDWQPGEGAEMALWDSPEKKVSLGRYTIWWESRGYQFARPEWEINARVQPNTKYYFEISYVGQGDGKLSWLGVMNGADDYKAGQGYLAGKEADFDVCFATHVRRPMDRIGNLKKAFARFNLDLPDLAEVKAAVAKEDFETAESALVKHFETRTSWPIYDPKVVPKIKPDFDTKQSDLAMQNYFSSSEMGSGYAGPDINWRAEPDFNPDGTVAASGWNTGMNRFGPRGPLTNGYLATGNEKYVRKMNDVLFDFYLDNPPPSVSHIGGDGSDPVWATLDCGIRLGANWVCWERIHASPYFTLDGKMAYLLNLADLADTLVLNGGGDGGNWAFLQNNCMLDFGLKNPEFVNAGKWQEMAAQRMMIAMKRDIHPDGVENEAAPGYQRMSYGGMSGVYDLIQETKAKDPFNGELKGILEKQSEYFMYLAMPSGITPFLGDWGNGSERDALKNDGNKLGRSDFLYVASAGKDGTKPKELSKLYPYFGIAMLRSDWGDAGKPYEDSRYMMMHGNWGSHGHRDMNEVTVYAHGRELLQDPGSYIYGSPEHELLCNASSHNVMTIDGQDQQWRTTREIKNWSTTPVADYISNWVAAYKGGEYDREVFYIRSNGAPVGDYWIVRDTALGTGSHSLEQRWHFCPGEASLDQKTLIAQTLFPTGGNLSIQQVQPSRLQAEKTTTDTWPDRNGARMAATKMPTMIYKTTAELPASIDTVLFPTEGKQVSPQPKVIETSPNGMDSAFKMVQGKVEDLFVLQKAAAPKTLSSEKLSFDGERVFVRRVGGKLQSALLVKGGNLTIGGKQIIKSAKPLSWISVSFDKTGTKVWTSSDEPSLVVAEFKGKPAVTNTDALIKTK